MTTPSLLKIDANRSGAGEVTDEYVFVTNLWAAEMVRSFGRTREVNR